MVVFDKTGTLTVGKPAVQQLVFIHEGMPCLQTLPANGHSKSTTTSNSMHQAQQADKQAPSCHAAAATQPASPFASDAIQHPEHLADSTKQHDADDAKHQQLPTSSTTGTSSSCCGDSSGGGGSKAAALAAPGAAKVGGGWQELTQRQRQLLAMLAAVEASSEHPLAKAIVVHAEQHGISPSDAGSRMEHFQSQTGRGVRCTLVPTAAPAAATTATAAGSSSGSNGTPTGAASSNGDGSCCTAAAVTGSTDVIVGSVTWLEECGVQLSAAARQQRAQLEGGGATVVAAAVDGRVVVLCSIADSIKPEAPAVLRLLQKRGMQCWMITGDSR